MPFQCGQCQQWHPSPKPAPECTCKSDPKTCRACEADAEFRASKAQGRVGIMTGAEWNEGDLVRFDFANRSAIEGYVRFSDAGEPWLDCGIGPFAHVLGPWFNAPDSPLRGKTPTLLAAAPPLIKSTDPVIQAVAQALLGEEATTTTGYYGASYRIDAEHAWDLAEIAVDAVRAIGVRP